MSLCRYLPTPSDRMGILWSLLCVEGSVIVEYGPAGTTHYSMGLFGELGIDQQNRLFSTHMSEDDVVMGDVSRLEDALVEVDESYHPSVIFVVASSVSAVIGTDLRGVCATMQPKVKARLIAFEQGGFRGDYSIGLKECYKLLAEFIAEPVQEKLTGKYNILGASAGTFRAKSDVLEIQRLMKEAFGMACHACLCLDTDAERIRTMGGAEINLVLRDEALPAARLLEEKCAIGYVQGMPYGYRGTLEWLERVGKALGRSVPPVLAGKLKKRSMEAAQYRMYSVMLKTNKPQVTILTDYNIVQGLSGFMAEIGFSVTNKISAHSLRSLEDPEAEVRYLPVEKERIDLLRSLHHQLLLADDVSARLVSEDNTYTRVSMPLVDGAQIANHMPICGPRGADMILESVERYLQTLK